MPANYQTVRLTPGRHQDPDNGVCVMELASMLADEPLTDRPRTVSGTLAGLLRGYNDGLDADRRQSLKAYAATSLGTAHGRALEGERRRIVRDWLKRERGTRGPLASLGRRLTLLDLHMLGRCYAQRVWGTQDEALHARMLGLFDALIAVGGPLPQPLPEAPRRDAVPA
jgi:plasmid stability protein